MRSIRKPHTSVPTQFPARFVACLFITVMAASAAVSVAGVPVGLASGRALSTPPTLTVALDPQVVDAAEKADRLGRERSRPTRFAYPIETNISPAGNGVWEELGDGSSLWRLTIAAPGAKSVNLRITRFNIPEGASLWLYDGDGAQVHGPYGPGDAKGLGELWTPVVLGELVTVELHVPAGARDLVDVVIGSVNHGYRFFSKDRVNSKQGNCNIDVICPEGDPWRDQIRSVARYTIDGNYLCTGTLVNNTAENLAPLFLSAYHCEITADNDHTIVLYWNYESPYCGWLGGGSLANTQTGSTFLASWDELTGSDFVLVELDEKPSEAYNVYYSGWDASATVPDSVVGIHHPNADEKAISLSNRQLSTLWGTHWLVPGWDQGTTEEGSSGSCLYDVANGRCVGTLTGGRASCTDPNANDWYGKLSVSWTGNNTSDSRLSDWLDPAGTGALAVDGIDPSGGSTENVVWLVPAAAAAPGYGNANWKSQLQVVNHNASTRTATVYFVASGDSWPGDRLAGPFTIGPNGTVFLDDPLLSRYPTTGLVYVTMDGSGTVVSSRTFSLDSSGTTYGQGIPGIPLDTATASSELILPMVNSAPGRVHTNLGLVQTSAGAYVVEVSLYSGNGTLLAQKNYAQTGAFRQINDVVGDLGLGGQSFTGAWIRARHVGGSPVYWTAYLSVVDDGSHDPTYVAGVAP